MLTSFIYLGHFMLKNGKPYGSVKLFLLRVGEMLLKHNKLQNILRHSLTSMNEPPKPWIQIFANYIQQQSRTCHTQQGSAGCAFAL